MIEWLKKIVRLFIERLYEITEGWGKGGETPPDPPKPPIPPSYIDEMRKSHPERSGEELSEVVELEALVNTHFYTPHVHRDGELARNEKGRLILDKYSPILQGASVLVYRWAFQVDGGNVRESRWHITDKKGLIDVKDFSKPTE